MSKVIKYGNEEQYDNDFKYWSNSCGELHHFGQEDITEDELPEELKPIYNEYWEENKDGNNVYLAQYKGVNGIALVNEYYETKDGNPEHPDINNYARAIEVADKMSKNEDCIVLLAKELGFPWPNNRASEVVVFMPSTINKDRFDEISKMFSEIAYIYEAA